MAYDKGAGVRECRATALRWWRKAAERGSPRAMFNVAVAIDQGIGVEADPAAAVELLAEGN